MANVFVIVGDTGTGKSTAIESLDPKDTFIVNCSNKPLPFKGSGSKYNLANKNTISYSTSKEVIAVMQQVEKQASIKNLIIDDSGFIMTELFFLKATETGYAKFTEIGKAYQSMLAQAKSMRNDLNIVFVLHEEDDTSNGVKVKRKVKTVGKLLDDQYSPLSVVTVALFTNVSYKKDDGSAQYQFITNRTILNGVEIPAKSPKGMFADLFIPNDLSLVFKAANEYYSG